MKNGKENKVEHCGWVTTPSLTCKDNQSVAQCIMYDIRT